MDTPHISDKKRLRAFFEDNFILTTYELATTLKIDPATVRVWKQECGIPLDPTNNIPPEWEYHKTKRKVKKVPPEVWDNKEWFYEHYINQNLGSYTIARMIGKSISFVVSKLRKLGIPVRTHAEAVSSRNKYCNKEWLEEFYVKRRLSLRRCGAIAGVSDYGILRWLVKFGIESRDKYEAAVAYDEPPDTVPSKIPLRTPPD